MVLEQAFRAKWLEQRPISALFLGLVYSIIGILSAKLIFPASSGLASIAFVSILLIPSLNRLLSDEENVEIRENKFSIRMLFRDHRDIFEIYFFMFIGIFLAYAMFAMFLPKSLVLKMFGPQINLIKGQGLYQAFVGYAFSTEHFVEILLNNLLVFIVCLVLSIVYGAGAIFFLAWNASAWGVIFAVNARVIAGIGSPLGAFFGVETMAPVWAHLITEAFSYFFAAVAGGVVSKAVMREDLFSEKFHHILSDAMMLLLIGFGIVAIAAFIEVYVYQYSVVILLGIMLLLILLIGALEPTHIFEKEGIE
ncbi:stage II sporulation protein M [Candidatus Woesearchaeota archaeon]|jgi:hypothetical protein|nr:stage II sporulation protein M [Candidatus Woesearchaeota archaeon]